MFAFFITLIYFIGATDVSTACFPAGEKSPDVIRTLTDEPCNYNKGRITEIGLKHGNVNFSKIKICQDTATQKVFWTKHSLFKTSPCVLDLALDYCNIAREALTDFGIENLHEDYDVGFLTPICDFDRFEEQQLAIDILNWVPVYKELRLGNWRTLESHIRDVVNNAVSNGHLDIITGTLEEIPCDDNSGIVYPKFLYKGISSSSGTLGVIVAVNGNETVDPATVCEVDPSGIAWAEQGKGQIFSCLLKEELKPLFGVEDKDLVY